MSGALSRRLSVVRVSGLLPYAEGLARQAQLAQQRQQGDLPDTLLLCEHPPVFTVGKRATTHNLLSSAAALAALGAEVHRTERGGDITFHGPGQLVLYPLLQLRQLGCGARAYVEGLEDVLQAVAARHGVTARGRLEGAPGLWVDEKRKLAAVGVRISQGVTSHGAALNVCTSLDWFKHIVPCGLTDKGVTSLHAELGGSGPSLDEVAADAADAFAAHFAYDTVSHSRM